MSSPAVQLSFTLRTSPNVKSVHLLGSWDNYKSQLPLSVLKDGKPGSWRGAFRFQGSHALKQGSRYWYYYIVDGYHVSHDPAKEFTTEPTTGRKLNILDVPQATGASQAAASSNRHSRDIPKGRPLSPTRIQHPKPTKEYASRQIREADFSINDLADRLEGCDLDYNKSSASPSSISSRSSSSASSVFSDSRSSTSSMSTNSTGSQCRCERYGVTRSGQRVKMDCGGRRCGPDSESDSDCSSDSSSSEEEVCRKPVSKPTATRVAVSRRR